MTRSTFEFCNGTSAVLQSDLLWRLLHHVLGSRSQRCIMRSVRAPKVFLLQNMPNNSNMGSIVPNHALPFCTYQTWHWLFNHHHHHHHRYCFFFLYCYVFKSKLEIDKDVIDSRYLWPCIRIDSFECTDSTPHFHIFLSVNALID